MRPRTFLLVWVLAVVPAAGFVALVERSDGRKAEFVRRARGRAEGTVLRRVEERGKYIRYTPIVGFTEAGGQRVEFKSRYADYLSVGEPRYAVGTRVPVVYVPEEPARAEIDEPRLHEKDATPFTVGGAIYIGFMTLVCGGLAFALGSKRAPDQPEGPLAPR